MHKSFTWRLIRRALATGERTRHYSRHSSVPPKPEIHLRLPVSNCNICSKHVVFGKVVSGIALKKVEAVGSETGNPCQVKIVD
jgi:hypothetical protein